MPTPVPQGLVPKTADFADRIRANFKTQSAMTTFGIEMLDVTAGHTRLEMLANDRVLQQQGFVHGGVIAAAMDSACGYAALSLAAADREVLTIEYKVSFIAPAVGERYEFEGQVIKPGRTISFTEGTAFAIHGGVRKLVATLNASMAIVAAPDA
ncbi:MAG: PaaI family thioesterase [Candidatus Puniceispirillaceae bacterium]